MKINKNSNFTLYTTVMYHKKSLFICWKSCFNDRQLQKNNRLKIRLIYDID